jgi:hypothetical protein
MSLGRQRFARAYPAARTTGTFRHPELSVNSLAAKHQMISFFASM